MYRSVYTCIAHNTAAKDPRHTTQHAHLYLYGASARMAAASSGSHLSPLARSFSATGLERKGQEFSIFQGGRAIPLL